MAFENNFDRNIRSTRAELLEKLTLIRSEKVRIKKLINAPGRTEDQVRDDMNALAAKTLEETKLETELELPGNMPKGETIADQLAHEATIRAAKNPLPKGSNNARTPLGTYDNALGINENKHAQRGT